MSFIRHILPVLFPLILVSCQERLLDEGSLLPDTLCLRSGDVVFRRCTGLNSEIVVRRDTGGIFSHVGIVVDSSGTLMVVHAVPGEPDWRGDPDRVKMDTPNRFFSRGRVVAAAVHRPCDSLAGQQAARKAFEVYRRGTLFDHDYDDSDTTRMYCTELLVHCYRSAGVDLVGTSRHTVSLPLFKCKCILPSQVYSSSSLEQIFFINQ